MMEQSWELLSKFDFWLCFSLSLCDFSCCGSDFWTIFSFSFCFVFSFFVLSLGLRCLWDQQWRCEWKHCVSHIRFREGFGCYVFLCVLPWSIVVFSSSLFSLSFPLSLSMWLIAFCTHFYRSPEVCHLSSTIETHGWKKEKRNKKKGEREKERSWVRWRCEYSFSEALKFHKKFVLHCISSHSRFFFCCCLCLAFHFASFFLFLNDCYCVCSWIMMKNCRRHSILNRCSSNACLLLWFSFSDSQ